MQVPRKIEYIYSRIIISLNNINFLEICQFFNKESSISKKIMLLLKMCTFSNSQTILGWTVVNSKGSRDSCVSEEKSKDIPGMRKGTNSTESPNDSPKLSLDKHRKIMLQPSTNVQDNLILIRIFRKFSGGGDTVFLNLPTPDNMSGGSHPPISTIDT